MRVLRSISLAALLGHLAAACGPSDDLPAIVGGSSSGSAGGQGGSAGHGGGMGGVTGTGGSGGGAGGVTGAGGSGGDEASGGGSGGSACAPSCAGRCGGDGDGCGGTCDAACPDDAMLLTTDGGVLVDGNGAPVDVRGAISCCGGGYGWPLFDMAWLDLVDGYGANFLHVRLGPFLTGEGGESDWGAIGGGYVEVDGKADLTRFNTAFWAQVRELIEAAAARGVWVEVDVIDGWAIKHCRWGDIPAYSAWSPTNNLQGEDWCDDAGSREIIGGDVHETWVRRVVHETGRYANVIYQDGNEVALIDGYIPEWSLSIRNIIHDQEGRDGYARHLFGTNSGDPVTLQADGVDFGELHQDVAAGASDCFGKPCLVNEYNPDPPLSPEAFRHELCTARARGTYFWYWRHGQDDDALRASLAMLDDGC